MKSPFIKILFIYKPIEGTVLEKETLFRAVVASGRTVEDVLEILKAQDQKE